MYLADLKMISDNGNCKLMECPLDYNEDRLKYTVEEIGDMPYLIDTQKKAATLQIPSNSEPVKIENSTMNKGLPTKLFRITLKVRSSC